MYKYVIKRLLLAIPVLIGATFLVFAIMDFAPGDPARIILGSGATEQALDLPSGLYHDRKRPELL